MKGTFWGGRQQLTVCEGVLNGALPTEEVILGKPLSVHHLGSDRQVSAAFVRSSKLIAVASTFPKPAPSQPSWKGWC